MATGIAWRFEKGFPSTPQVLFQLKSSPRVSHGGVSNQGRKTAVLNISNWCLETIALHATDRKMWGEWVSELSEQVSILGQTEGKLVSFLYAGKS